MLTINEGHGPQNLPRSIDTTSLKRSGPDTFLADVVERVSGNIIDDLDLKLDRATGSLIISHVGDIFGRQQTFSYRILFRDGQEIAAPVFPSLDGYNDIIVPAGVWDPYVIEELRYAWNRTILHDPFLYRRHREKGEVILESFQEEACRAIYADLQVGRSGVVVIPTGGGKTVVADEVMVKYLLEQRQATVPGGARPLVLFMVDNNIILDEASDKLSNYIRQLERNGTVPPGSIRLSKVYGDNKDDFSGDVVYSTPSSLASAERLSALIHSGRLCLVVIDEAHHALAPEQWRILGHLSTASHERSWGTRFLPLTATPVRMDGAEVLRAFGGKSYEISHHALWHRGLLARMRYHIVDKDINPAQRPMLDSDPLYEEFLAKRYNPQRFPAILDLYERAVRDSLDRRALFIHPRIDVAEQFDRECVKRGLRSATLTSDDRNFDSDLFKRRYENWKAGHAYPHREVGPIDIVNGVGIFYEGIDVPGVSRLYLLADLGSLTRWTQVLGRILRPGPGKTGADMNDLSGIARRVPFLQGLMRLTSPPAEGSRGDRPERETAVEYKHTTIFALGDGTSQVQAHFDCSLLHLEYQYGSYFNLDPREKGRLDAYLARVCGFRDTVEFDVYMSELAGTMQGGLSPADREAVRNRLRPAFHVPAHYEVEDGPEIKTCIANTFAFWRIHEKLVYREEDPVEEKVIYSLFDEFQAERMQIARTVAHNLRQLRLKVFRLAPQDMNAELYENLGVKQRLTAAHLPGMQEIVAHHVHGLRDTTSIEYAEGAVEARERARLHDLARSTQIETTASIPFWQQLIVPLYLHHERLQGKLTAEQFTLPPAQFQLRLLEQGLVLPTSITARQFFADLKKRVTAYTEAVRENEVERATALATSTRAFCREGANPDFFDADTISETHGSSLQTLFGAMTAVRSSPDLAAVHAEMIALSKELLERSGRRIAIPVAGEEGLSVVIQRSTRQNIYELTAERIADPGQELVTGPAVNWHFMRDDAGRRHLIAFRPNEERTHIEEVYESLSPDGRFHLLSAAADGLASFQEQLDGIVAVIPEYRDGPLFRELQTRLIEDTDMDVLGPIHGTGERYSAGSFRANVKELRSSRLVFLTPGQAEAYALLNRKSLENRTPTIAGRLHYIYDMLYERNQVLAPLHQPLLRRLEELSENPRLAGACAFLAGWVNQQFDKELLGLGNRRRLLELHHRLEHVGQSGRSVETDLLAAAYKIIWDFPRKSRPIDAARETGGVVAALNVYLRVHNPRPLPEGLEPQLQEYFEAELEAFIGRGDGIYGFDPAALQKGRALKLILESQSVPAAEAPAAVASQVQEGLVPPLFTADRGIYFWMEKLEKPIKGARYLAHWDPNCKALAARSSGSSKGAEVDLADTRSIEMFGFKAKFVCCQTCRTPNNKIYWEEERKKFYGEYGGKVYDPATGRNEAPIDEDDE